MVYFLFFCSGLSGLIYQVVWVREFGNVFGNTVYSASLVVAVFMLGLGFGSYGAGGWADRRYTRQTGSLLRAYGQVELIVAALGLSISLVLPGLNALSAISSSYVIDRTGWFVLSSNSYVSRGAIVFVLLTPVTLLMGGTLTLLIRHLVRRDVEAAGWKIAVLYGVNTAGAAAGAFLTDFVLVPAAGQRATQMVAVALNVIAGVGALALGASPGTDSSAAAVASRDSRRRQASSARKPSAAAIIPAGADIAAAGRFGGDAVMWTSFALGLSGFAALGMEILWFRHFTLLLGGFRAVFSLLLTIILIGIGVGSLVGGVLVRRTTRPAQWLMIVQSAFVAVTLLGLFRADVRNILATRGPVPATSGVGAGLSRTFSEVWFDGRPILLEVGCAALLMGLAFPVANAIVQRAERSVGRRAGVLYLANTVGAVGGSIATGFLLLPWLGMQGSATVLMIAAALTTVPLYLATVRIMPDATYEPSEPDVVSASRRTVLRLPRDGTAAVAACSLLISGAALGLWLLLPSGYLLARAMAPPRPGERLLTMSEGVSETIAVAEAPGRGRALITDGHPMSSTALLDQRYMRALAHIPLLSMERPSRVLVIGFGVGNSTHAATLHPSVERVEVADLSRHVLEHASYFRDANHDVLQDRRVTVYENDGRQHLQMQPLAVYDLITLEPPPIAHAGVAALYSREFYALARTRLTPGGYVSQWLPAYQVPARTSLAMIRAFIDVFPQSVLLSGMSSEFVLIGTNADTIQIDPDRLAAALKRAPAVLEDLRRIDLGTVTEIVGTFVGSADTLVRATRESTAVSDDRPIQEYGVRSAIGSGPQGVPASVFDLSAAATWCPRCFSGDLPAASAPGLDTYLALLDQAYHASTEAAALGPSGTPGPGRILGSAYLGAVLPDTDAVHNVIGVTLLRERRYPEAAAAFREALKRRADSVDANRNLGTALAESGQTAEAIGYLRRAVQLDPGHGGAQYELGSLLLERREFGEAAAHLRAALRAMPDSAAAHNGLGIALASTGALTDALDEFQQALRLRPDFAEARRNLELTVRRRSIDTPRERRR
ncbi:MAG: tetratricopeptide repeat protein [Acidobacteriota bacterium]